MPLHIQLFNTNVNMKSYKFIFFVFTVCFTTCTTQQSVIEGTLSSDRYNNEVVYWVPFKDASSETVDSGRIKKNTFRISISDHNLNKMGIVRVKPLLRLGLQDILVFAESGTVHVHLDSVSRATGTPLNEKLQYWKDRKRTYDVDLYALRRKLRTADADDQPSIKIEMENVSKEYHNDIFQIVVENKDNELGKFLYSLHKGRFTPEQIEVLNNYHLE